MQLGPSSATGVRTVKTWRRERRVSAAARGIAPGHTPGPLWVYVGLRPGQLRYLGTSCLRRARRPFALLVEGAGPQDALWESLRVFLRHNGGVLKGHLEAASAAFLEATACELDAAQANWAHDLAWRKLRSLTCRGGAKWKGAKSLPGRVGEDGVAATKSQEVSAAGVVLRHFAAQAMSPLRRCVCPRQAVSTKAKLTFVDSLATSRLHMPFCWCLGQAT